MGDAKTSVWFVVTALSLVLQPGIEAQPTIGFPSEDDSCPQPEQAWTIGGEDNMPLRSVLERELMETIIKALKSESDFHAKESLRLKLELETKQENISNSYSEEIQQLRLENEGYRRKTQPVRATFSGRPGKVDFDSTTRGIAKIEDTIYVLYDNKPDIITVFEDRNDFRFMQDILLNESTVPNDIVYSNHSKCVYMGDLWERCIWVMNTTGGEHRMTKWLTNVTSPRLLSLTNDGRHLLVLRNDISSSQLDVYWLNATLFRRLQLSPDIKETRHVVQTSDGNFILLHKLRNSINEPWVISQLTNDGLLIHRFIPRNSSEHLRDPDHLCLDSDNNRLFVTDWYRNRVIVFDSTVLTWSQVLVFEDMKGIDKPRRLFYDESKKHLFVGQERGDVGVYQIS